MRYDAQFRMRILIIYDHVGDDASPDQADALSQARAIAAALERLGHEWMTLGVTLDLEATREAVARLQPDLVFNLVESLGGSGRLIHAVPALLDVLGVPYTGATAEMQFITSHKPLAKALLQAAGIDTPQWTTIEELRRGDAQVDPNVRWLIKSLWEHASVGLDEHSVVTASDAVALRNEIETRLGVMGGSGFAERYIDGREFNIALLADAQGEQPEALPAAEIVFNDLEQWGQRPRIVNYACKWDEGSFEYHHTERRFDFPSVDQPLIESLTAIARRCWRIFELRGYARVDFRVENDGKAWVLEVNTNPCLSSDAGFAAALDRGGIEYPAAIGRILNDAVRPADRRQTSAAPLRDHP